MKDALPAPIELPGWLLGLLSDSHARHARTAHALELLVEHHPDVIIHLGDICDDRVLDVLAGSPVPVRFVWGNMDDSTSGQQHYAEHLGLHCDHPVGVYRMSGKLLVATHGHLQWVQEAARKAGVDYFLHGHTHLVRDEQIQSLRFINPGALQRASRYTVGVLNVVSGGFSVLEISDLDLK